MGSIDSIIICSGFIIRNSTPTPNAPETDGPSGALLLALALLQLNKRVLVLVDAPCFDLFQNLSAYISSLTDLTIEIETITNDHLESYKQFDAILFTEKCGPNLQNQHLTMRASNCDAFNSLLFTVLLDFFTHAKYSFCIGDGGNEHGCGNFEFSQLQPPEIHCVTKCCDLLLADVSNLGAVLLSRVISQEQSFVRRGAVGESMLVRKAVKLGAVDGVLLSNTVSVDGIDFQKYCGIVDQVME